MMNMLDLITAMQSDPACTLYPPAGLPALPPGLTLPEDMLLFYTHCGGGYLFGEEGHSLEIFSPSEVVSANDVCLRELSRDEVINALGTDHFSWGWYLIADYGGAEYVAINLLGADQGSCYDCFWETYPNQQARLTSSFTEFVARMYSDRGKQRLECVFFPERRGNSTN